MKNPKVLCILVLLAVVQVNSGLLQWRKNAVSNKIGWMINHNLYSLIKIPDQSFKNIKLTDIKVLSLTYPIVNIVETSSTLQVRISNLGAKLSANWKAEKKILFVKLKGRGSVTFSGSGIGINLTLSKRTLRVLRCDDWIKTLSYKIKGKNLTGKLFSFVANIFRKRIVKKIKAELDGKLCSAVTKLIHRNAGQLAKQLGLSIIG